jgi:hypothetical protein
LLLLLNLFLTLSFKLSFASLASLLLGFNYSFDLYLASLASLLLLLNLFLTLSFELSFASLASLLLYFLLPFTFYLLYKYAYKRVTSIS